MLARRFRKRHRITPEQIAETEAIAWVRKRKIEPQYKAHDRLPPEIIHALALADVPFEANYMLKLLKNGIPAERIIDAIKVVGMKMPPKRVQRGLVGEVGAGTRKRPATK